jgi:DNA-binding transcriptional ArsR family regulator
MTPLVDRLRAQLSQRPHQFSELVDAHRDVSWRSFLKAWGALRAANILKRDEDGNYTV